MEQTNYFIPYVWQEFKLVSLDNLKEQVQIGKSTENLVQRFENPLIGIIDCCKKNDLYKNVITKIHFAEYKDA